MLWNDVRFAVRNLARNPGFAIVAVLVLALGIGATTAVFSVVNAVLLRPLPYSDPGRLVAVSSIFQPGKANRIVPVIALSDVEEWRKQTRSVESMGAFAYTELPVRVAEQSYYPVTALMDPEFLPTLGNPLAMGTLFSRQAGDDNTVIITHRLWLEAFNGDPAVVGKSMTVDGASFTVRGVLRAGFQFPRADASYFTKDIDMLMPAASFPGFPATSRQWFGIARLRAGVSMEQAQSEMQTVANGIAESSAQNKDWTVRLTRLDEETTRNSRSSLLIVLGISLVLLLIAATNLMNLLFSRGASRLREMAIRKAIGSTTGHLIRQMLTESVCLAVPGGIGGILVASIGIDTLVALSPVHLPVTQGIGIDGTVLAFSFVVCVVVALLAGLFPAVHVSLQSDEAIRNPGMRATTGRALGRIQNILCIIQMALGVALLSAAGLLTHSLMRLNHVDPGFRSENTLGFNLSVPDDHSMDQRKRFYQAALDEIRQMPGVTSAGWITFLPPETRAGVFMGMAIEGTAPPLPGTPPPVVNNLISSVGYFPTMGIPLASGRDFNPSDSPESQPVIIVNEALGRKYFSNENPLGHKIGTGFGGTKLMREIVGVVRDTHDRGLAVNAIPTVYIPFTQFALSYGSIALRTSVAPESLVPEIRRRLAKIDPAIPLTDFQALDTRLHESLEEPRFYTLMAGACAFMAVFFVSLGLYGIVSFSVQRRTPEFGIRMAVGAPKASILNMVLLQGLQMAVVGVVLGIALSLGLTRLLTSLLFEIKPVDPVTLAGAAVVVVLVTLLASYLPARRATEVDPRIALRGD